jgi:hypothetical protein
MSVDPVVSELSTDEEIVYADKNLRRWVLILAIVLALIALCVFKFTQGYVRDIVTLAEDNPQEMLRKSIVLANIAVISFSAGILAVFGYFLWLGIKIIKANQYPVPGMRVIRDTKILRGERARSRAGMAIALATGILIAGCAVAFFGSELLAGLTEKAHEKGQARNIVTHP